MPYCNCGYHAIDGATLRDHLIENHSGTLRRRADDEPEK